MLVTVNFLCNLYHNGDSAQICWNDSFRDSSIAFECLIARLWMLGVSIRMHPIVLRQTNEKSNCQSTLLSINHLSGCLHIDWWQDYPFKCEDFLLQIHLVFWTPTLDRILYYKTKIVLIVHVTKIRQMYSNDNDCTYYYYHHYHQGWTGHCAILPLEQWLSCRTMTVHCSKVK